MESITIKVDGALAKEIDKAIKPYYSTKTEFIREAIREKIVDVRTKRALELLEKNLGSSKIKTPLWMDEVIREKAGRKFAKKFGIKLH